MIEMWLCIPYDAGCWASVLPLLVFIEGLIGAKKSGTNKELTPSLWEALYSDAGRLTGGRIFGLINIISSCFAFYPV